MIPHIQTFTAGAETWEALGETTPGNCMQAAVASLLDLPLALVPHFALFGNRWGGAIVQFLGERGKRLRVYTDSDTTRGYFEFWGVTVAALDVAPTGQLLIASGPSLSGPWSHVVLWRGGSLVHDVHPLQRGLAGAPFEFWQITDGEAPE